MKTSLRVTWLLSHVALLVAGVCSFHILLLRGTQASPGVLGGWLALGLALAWLNRMSARRVSPELRSRLEKQWAKLDGSGLILLSFFLLLTVVFHLSFQRAAGDGREYFVHVRSLVMDFDFDFSNEDFGANEAGTFPVGSAILWVPFFIAGHLWLGLLNLLGEDYVRDGFTNPYQMAIGLGSLTYGCVGLVLIYNILSDYFLGSVALFSTIVLCAGSFILYYLVFDNSYSHANSLFAVTLFVFTWHRTRSGRSVGHWWLLGITAGLMTMVRWQNAVFVLLPAADVIQACWVARRGTRLQFLKIAKEQLGFVSAGFLTFLPQLYFWKVNNGGWLVVPHGQMGQQWWRDSLVVDVLFSPNHGLLAWHPLIYFAVLGIPLFLKKDVRFGGLLCGVFLAQVYIVGASATLFGGSAFGLYPSFPTNELRE